MRSSTTGLRSTAAMVLSPATIVMGIVVVAMLAAHAPARAATFKCVDATGKTSYQAAPCDPASEPTLKVQVPAPALIPAPGTAQPAAASATATSATSAGSSGTVPASARASKNRVPSESDFKGPRETWERLGAAIRRGDKDAAIKELTPAAQRRLAPVVETIGSKTAPFNADELGSIRSVTLAGDGLATITLTRTKPDGTYLYQVNLIRDPDGKWRVDNM